MHSAGHDQRAADEDSLGDNVMAYFETPEFDAKAKAAQTTMLPGIYDQFKDDILDWNSPVILPIGEGEARWTKFTVHLTAFQVIASYELLGADENPQFAGVAVSNDVAIGFSGPNVDRHVVLGDTYPIGLEVLKIDYLNLIAHSAEVVVRAYDQTESIAKAIASKFADTARLSLKGVTALIPYGDKVADIGGAVIGKIEDIASAPRQIGSHYHMFKVPIAVFWQRPPEMTSWFKYKFVAFVEEDPDDKEKPYKEIYLTVWELRLLSDAAIVGEDVKKLRRVKKEKQPGKPTETPPG